MLTSKRPIQTDRPAQPPPPPCRHPPSASSPLPSLPRPARPAGLPVNCRCSPTARMCRSADHFIPHRPPSVWTWRRLPSFLEHATAPSRRDDRPSTFLRRTRGAYRRYDTLAGPQPWCLCPAVADPLRACSRRDPSALTSARRPTFCGPGLGHEPVTSCFRSLRTRRTTAKDRVRARLDALA